VDSFSDRARRRKAFNFKSTHMPNFEIRTHQTGRTYSGPHFFILCRAERKETVRWTVLVIEPAGAVANSGRPMPEPCPNCFVITTSSEDLRESLFYLCLALKAGKYFSYYLKGSVIPFICIAAWDQKILKLQKIEAFEANLKLQLKTISELKMALLRF